MDKHSSTERAYGQCRRAGSPPIPSGRGGEKSQITVDRRTRSVIYMTELDHINMTTQNIAPSREHVERLVRESIYSQFGRPAPVDGPSSLVVNSSARHMHISQENLEVLFGPGAELEVHKWLYQEGQFAAKQTVTLVGPRKRIIPNLRILGPCPGYYPDRTGLHGFDPVGDRYSGQDVRGH
jgi:hypothetical protein